ncbi:unnamed protein product, partial [marine sediment metagenome]
MEWSWALITVSCDPDRPGVVRTSTPFWVYTKTAPE